jgi:5-methylthioribose kinase
MTAAKRPERPASPGGVPDWITRLLQRAAKASAHIDNVSATPLGGGVSSDIYRVEAGTVTLCVKRALPKLKVAADWQVPVERNRYEIEWLRVAAALVPGRVPAVLAEDAEAGAFAMEWLDPATHPVWKQLLAEGRVDSGDAGEVGATLGRIHAGTADRADIAARFAATALFDALRLEPYLMATAAAHADLAASLQRVADVTRSTQRVLVHGDFSPKNLLIGPAGPIVLDAECAWFGDPAFDLAFVLNHLLLKGAWRPQWRTRYADAFTALLDSYRRHVRWEPWDALERRTTALVPALMLARIDGKSPVEYLDAGQRSDVRDFARQGVGAAPAGLYQLLDSWTTAS